MGNGSVSSHRWHRNDTRPHPTYEELKAKAQRWENDAMQYLSERDKAVAERERLADTCTTLSLQLAAKNQKIAQYAQALQEMAFTTPNAPANAPDQLEAR